MNLVEVLKIATIRPWAYRKVGNKWQVHGVRSRTMVRRDHNMPVIGVGPRIPTKRRMYESEADARMICHAVNWFEEALRVLRIAETSLGNDEKHAVLKKQVSDLLDGMAVLDGPLPLVNRREDES